MATCRGFSVCQSQVKAESESFEAFQHLELCWWPVPIDGQPAEAAD